VIDRCVILGYNIKADENADKTFTERVNITW